MPGSDRAVPGSPAGTPGDAPGVCCLFRAGETHQPMSISQSSREDVPIRHAGINLLLLCILTKDVERTADYSPTGQDPEPML